MVKKQVKILLLLKIENEGGGKLFVIASDKKLNYLTYAEMTQAKMRG
jgi:hypothetical protein